MPKRKAAAAEPTNEHVIGFQFFKKFPAYGVWEGVVVHYDPSKAAPYCGRYQDGTDEWYTLSQLRTNYKLYKPTAAKKLKVAPWASSTNDSAGGAAGGGGYAVKNKKKRTATPNKNTAPFPCPCQP